MFLKKKPQTKFELLFNLMSERRRRKRLGKVGAVLTAFQAMKIVSDSKMGDKNAR